MNENGYRCLRCGGEMHLLKKEKLQLGEATPWTQQLHHYVAGALEVEIYVCPGCGKLEFFQPAAKEPAPEAPPKRAGANKIVGLRCPVCSRVFPADAKFCPDCGEAEGPLLPQVRCPACGTVHDFDDPRCPTCRQTPPEPRKTENNR